MILITIKKNRILLNKTLALPHFGGWGLKLQMPDSKPIIYQLFQRINADF